MRNFIILALASLMSNMTEAIKVTAADSDSDNVKLYELVDCNDEGHMEEKKKGPFCTADRSWCKKADSVIVPVGKALVVRYKDLNIVALLTHEITGDGTCVNVEDTVLSAGGYSDASEFRITGGNIIFVD